MYAIVLTHDGQLGLAELVHKLYSTLWPTHGLTFRVPVNGSPGGSARAYLDRQSDCRLIDTPPTIEGSMRVLLRDLPDDEWVFWCIDDRFPMWLDARALDGIRAGLDACADHVEELKLLRWREPLTKDQVVVGPVDFHVQRRRTRQWGFWHHHFVRVATLRRVFLRDDLPDGCPVDGFVASLRHDNARRLPFGRRQAGGEGDLFRGKALVPTRPLLELGEPLVDGVLTANGLTELRRRNCEIPPYPSNDRRMVYAWSEG
jgi:hypothetical protein